MGSKSKTSLKKKKSIPRKVDNVAGGAKPEINTQHNEWVKFQQSIAVEGFDTGQTVTAVQTSTRGGVKFNKKKERERIAREGVKPPQLGGGEFPALRFSDEETERLLTQAYANIPVRTGKRGTRNLTRQRVRFRTIRKIHAKEKKWGVQAHFRKMGERGRNVAQVLEVKRTSAGVREEEKAYREKVLADWYKITVLGDKPWLDV